MFRTLDAMRSKTFFWDSLTRIRSLPCNPCAAGFSAAVLTVPADRLALVVAPADLPEANGVCFVVQLRDMAVDDVVVDVVLGPELHFLNGSAFGSPSDEFGAAQALGAFAFEIGQGEWEVLVKEEEEDGDE